MKRKIKQIVKTIILSSKSDKIRAIYWNSRAKEIDEKWGEAKSDFEVIKKVLNIVKPRTLLDIGCGSGRLFPLYSNVEIIYAQEVSVKAIKICKRRYPGLRINYLLKDLRKLDFKKDFFELIISNRVLAAIIPEKIEIILNKLSNLAKYIYINEITDSDDNGLQNDYFFKHDYRKILIDNNFELIETGMIDKQTWYLFRKK